MKKYNPEIHEPRTGWDKTSRLTTEVVYEDRI